MSYSLETYKKIFINSFSLEEDYDFDSLSYQSIPIWDSVGHMSLIADIEDQFNVMLDTEDIIDFSSFSKGIELLSKYNVEIK
jgi:acyl carrier protein